MTTQGAVAALEWSRPRIWRMETGLVPMRPTDVEVMCRLYGATPETTDVLKALARETKAKGWWHSYGGDAVPSWFELYVGLEQAATRIREYQTDLVPGLLQTGQYMDEVITLDHPAIRPDDSRRRTALRRQRQELLSRVLPPAPRYDAILSEAVLRRPIADRKAMARQLRHLAAADRWNNVSVRIVPLECGLHSGAVSGSFSILDFARHGREQEPSTVYSESLSGARYVEKPTEVATYTASWSSLTGLALDEAGSRRLISRIAEEYDHNE